MPAMVERPVEDVAAPQVRKGTPPQNINQIKFSGSHLQGEATPKTKKPTWLNTWDGIRSRRLTLSPSPPASAGLPF